VNTVVISGTGLYSPPDRITNEELVTAFNEYVRRYNQAHQQEINAGELVALQESSVEFIVKASGIKNRHVIDKKGMLDPEILSPRLPERPDEQISLQAEMCIAAAKEALSNARKTAADIDFVILSCSNMQRAYPNMAIEVQNALGISGYALDMSVGCSSVTFGMQAAYNALVAGTARTVLMVNPEICSGHINYRDRDSHFIFGDICTAAVLECADTCKIQQPYELLNFKLLTQFSNNIRNNFGFLNRSDPDTMNNKDKLFIQKGRQVFKEVVPMVARLILGHLEEHNLDVSQIKRLWLHQANINMNQLVAEKVLGREATPKEAPVILDEYANTASAGSLIVFHKYQ
jgi:beta-ketodecanoyl-[acyl-carrier-protein] synthase